MGVVYTWSLLSDDGVCFVRRRLVVRVVLDEPCDDTCDTCDACDTCDTCDDVVPCVDTVIFDLTESELILESVEEAVSLFTRF